MTEKEIEYLRTVIAPQIEAAFRGRKYTEQAVVFNTAIGHNHDGRNSRLLADASVTSKGGVELATDAETLAGTDIGRVITPSNLEYARAQSGWIPSGETWTYASADDPTFTFTISGDLTGKYSPGMRLKLTQTTVKYFLITAVSYSSPNTTITVYGGTDYDLANATITSPYYSTQKAPQGFPLDPTKWTVEVTDGTDRSQGPADAGVWYNIGTTNSQITIPIGIWRVQYQVNAQSGDTGGSANFRYIRVTLSTTNNSESDVLMGAQSVGHGPATGALLHRERVLSLTVKTLYYLNALHNLSGENTYFVNSYGKLIIRAISAYL